MCWPVPIQGIEGATLTQDTYRGPPMSGQSEKNSWSTGPSLTWASPANQAAGSRRRNHAIQRDGQGQGTRKQEEEGGRGAGGHNWYRPLTENGAAETSGRASHCYLYRQISSTVHPARITDASLPLFHRPSSRHSLISTNSPSSTPLPTTAAPTPPFSSPFCRPYTPLITTA